MEPGIISLMVGSLNIASYYAGPEKGLYVILLLNLDDDPDSYEGGLADATHTIIKNYEDGSFKKIIPSLFQRISAFPLFVMEQKLAIIYQDDVKRLIINRLREEGVVAKSELKIWLKDIYRERFVDIDNVLMELIKKDLIKEVSVKEIQSELIFLTNDITIIRLPPIKLIDDPVDRGLPEALFEDYNIAVIKFFKNYKPTEEDNLKILDLISDPQVYEVLKLLRTTIATRDVLQKLRKKGVDDVDEVLNRLWKEDVIQVFQHKGGTEYYALLTDLRISMTYPKYILNTIIHQYSVKSKANKVLLEYLNVLEDTYFEMKSRSKSTD
ncbi:MAG: hypothetical protein GF353_20655 [Candidatus Lokiarchaeota archaeon]|nr:hypothetical protein [Candidatus Lokiarchaeota archaeon]